SGPPPFGFRQLPANGALHSYTCCAGEPAKMPRLPSRRCSKTNSCCRSGGSCNVTNLRASALPAVHLQTCDLNRMLAENLPIEQIFIFPAMGDEGMPAGGGLCYLLQPHRPRHLVSPPRGPLHVDFCCG